VIGAVIGAVVFHEPFGRHRVVATLVVAAGVVLTILSRFTVAQPPVGGRSD
jgi:drug/metabolite transporter (DMT)-like permease